MQLGGLANFHDPPGKEAFPDADFGDDGPFGQPGQHTVAQLVAFAKFHGLPLFADFERNLAQTGFKGKRGCVIAPALLQSRRPFKCAALANKAGVDHLFVQHLPGSDDKLYPVETRTSWGIGQMSSDKDSFEDRLRRIRETRAEASPAGGPGRGLMPNFAPKSNPTNLWLLALVLVGLVGAGAIALGVMAVAAKIAEGPLAMAREVQANLQGKDVAPAEPGVIERLAGFLFSTSPEGGRNPINFLPPAPDGWVRVTAEDAALPDALDAIKARWPQGDGVFPIEENLGFKHLSQYLESRAAPDMEQKVLAKNRTSAVYLNGNGQFLNVQLDHLPERSALGSPNDPAGWVESLAATEEKSLESGEILERLTLGGIEVTNQTKPAGKSLVARPIGTDIYAPNAVKIAVALTNRAVLRLQGAAAPSSAEAIITAIDRDGLDALND